MGCSYSEIDLPAFFMESDEFNIDDLIFSMITAMRKEPAWIAHIFPSFIVERLVHGDETVKLEKTGDE